MFCKKCDKSCAPQFDLCYDHRQWQKKKKFKRMDKKMTNLIIPKEDIEKLEESRLNLYTLIKDRSALFVSSIIFDTTSKIYAITHRKYEETIK